MIEVCSQGIFRPVLPHGIEPNSFHDCLPQLENVHQELMRRRQSDVGFYGVADQLDETCKTIEAEAQRLRALADDLLILGIGGSSLGGRALVRALVEPATAKGRVHFLDNVDPESIAVCLAGLEPTRTAALVISKSGRTVETMAQLLLVQRWFSDSVGRGASHSRLSFITDPDNGPLRQLANEHGIHTLPIAANIGGRYSALTAVGLLPLAFAGADIKCVLEGAGHMVEQLSTPSLADNPAYQFALTTLMAQRHLGANALVMMPYADALGTLSQWFVQLWAESLGKKVNRDGQVVHVGQTPIAAIGASDQHAQLQLFVEGPRDKLVTLISVAQYRHTLSLPEDSMAPAEFTFLEGKQLSQVLQAECRATRAGLLDAGVPVCQVQLPTIDAAHMGGLMMMFEAACACVGLMHNINPFDQPGVEAGKRMALGLLGCAGYQADKERVLQRE